MRMLLALAALFVTTAAQAQQADDSTPWNPEAVPAQTVFDYGAKSEPTLVCAPNKYCGLALETGETVQSTEANEDDWSVTATTYGAGKLAKPMILVTPFAPGLKDELTIATTAANGQARTYKLILVSDADKWTPLASYRYSMAQ
jgi:type IV secretory pathway VirB9-like protein